ncbi:MAG TPA: pyrroline-5-carboxylate reductase [Clostridiales bacterium]|nr:pyrroline-5-carboxylate reductase [Clostridiales bacterium]
MNIRIGFIGTGNMGKAMMSAMVMTGDIPANSVRAYDIDKVRARDICEELGTIPVDSPGEVVEASDIIFLCVKPDAAGNSLQLIKKDWIPEKILVSIVVGIPMELYHSILGQDARIVRTMPNTPATVGEGMTLYCNSKNIPSEDMERIISLLSCLGRVEALEEKLMAEVTALTSSSPAYVFMMIEAMADAAVLSGIKREQAYRLAAQAVLGAAEMVLALEEHPGKLKDCVCSPGGTTIEAVRVLERCGFRSALIEAMTACTDKAKAIGEQYRNIDMKP